MNSFRTWLQYASLNLTFGSIPSYGSQQEEVLCYNELSSARL